jgi:hypothetical protein
MAGGAGPTIPSDSTASAPRKLWIRLALAAAIIVAVAIYWLTRPA